MCDGDDGGEGESMGMHARDDGDEKTVSVCCRVRRRVYE